MAHTIKYRIKPRSLFERLGVGYFDSYYSCRLLRWAGHVARMPDRMSRKLLSGWGCTLKKALKSYDLPTDFGQWNALAADPRVRQQRIGVRFPCLRLVRVLVRG
jgi:hypothetical protein